MGFLDIRARGRVGIALQTVLLMLCPVFAVASDFQTPAITAQDLHTQQASEAPLLVIDVREVGEYKSGHVPGAINIPHKKLQQQLDKLLDANGVVLYCINGRRTRLAEQTLIENDIPNVFHLEGGLMGWRQAGFKVNTGWGPP
jgi:rhodanese-related sulfurtransferase